MERRIGIREWLGGCIHVCAITLFACVLLVMNGGVVAAIYFSIAAVGPKPMADPRMAQLALYVLPVLMLIGQWHLVDMAGSYAQQSKTD